jgi:catechol 2,3-dioxygenase-like lactoylglutathione lyase family enzyme
MSDAITAISNDSGDLGLRRLHHVALSVADIDTAIEWYQRILGGIVRLDYEMEEYPGVRIVFVVVGEVELELIYVPGSSPYPTEPKPDEIVRVQGYSHLAFRVDDCKATAELLRERGAEIAWEPRDWEQSSLRTCNLLDPDGNIVELVEELGEGR